MRNHYDEILDLVNEQDQVIGQLVRSVVHARKLSNFRAINAFLVNTKGQLWIPRRTAHKPLFPLCLDMSIAGHVSSGETYEQAFAREAMEEVSLDMTLVPYQVLGKLTPHEHGVSAFQQVYKIQIEDVPNYNRNDFIEYYWLTPDQVLQRIKAGDKAKGDLPKLIKFFQKNLS
jgi:isopentenyl-diphosphate delta-isomerase